VPAAAAAHAPTSLKAAFKGDFVIGVAINAAQITGKDQFAAMRSSLSQFNSISPENVLKWIARSSPAGQVRLHACRPSTSPLAKNITCSFVGHNLVWHSQVPAWVFHDDNGNLLTRDALLARMRDHIHTVVGRYKGKIQSWDVVNEALNEDGTMRQSLWYKIIGDDYIEKAFTVRARGRSAGAAHLQRLQP
jgi:endo-1,4-beta-xylanase